MRKRTIDQVEPKVVRTTHSWLDLEHLALVEITSEAPGYPIEAALTAASGAGWRAATVGAQTIRLWFDQPLHLNCIQLTFDEHEHMRTQEFVLRWSVDGGQSYQEVVRQQYTFSPPTTTHEVESYQVDLAGVTVLELYLVPDISGGPVPAMLTTLQLA